MYYASSAAAGPPPFRPSRCAFPLPAGRRRGGRREPRRRHHSDEPVHAPAGRVDGARVVEGRHGVYALDRCGTRALERARPSHEPTAARPRLPSATALHFTPPGGRTFTHHRSVPSPRASHAPLSRSRAGAPAGSTSPRSGRCLLAGARARLASRRSGPTSPRSRGHGPGRSLGVSIMRHASGNVARVRGPPRSAGGVEGRVRQAAHLSAARRSMPLNPFNPFNSRCAMARRGVSDEGDRDRRRTAAAPVGAWTPALRRSSLPPPPRRRRRRAATASAPAAAAARRGGAHAAAQAATPQRRRRRSRCATAARAETRGDRRRRRRRGGGEPEFTFSRADVALVTCRVAGRRGGDLDDDRRRRSKPTAAARRESRRRRAPVPRHRGRARKRARPRTCVPWRDRWL